MSKLISLTQKTYLLWMVLFVALAMLMPNSFTWLAPYITWMLGIIMFGMGMSMRLADFKSIVQHPKALLVGVVAQFLFMPLLAYLLAKGLNLPKEIAIGVILVGCCPGGTASNVITYLARGNIALSISCTATTTLLAPFLTPLLFYFFAHEWIEINALSMFISVIQMILLPIVLGVVVRLIFGKSGIVLQSAMPVLSMAAIIIIIAAIVAVSRESILSSGLMVFVVVLLHNLLGCLFGYAVSRIFKLAEKDSRTISIEVGMQNSGLGAALAAVHFISHPLVAVPSALFSLVHNITGSLLARYWTKREI